MGRPVEREQRIYLSLLLPGNRRTVCGDQEPVLLIKFGALGVLGQPLKTLSKCREEFSDDGKHERRPGLLTELHPGDLSCHCCNVGKTKAMTWAHWERGDQRIRNGESGPDNLNRRPRCERKCVVIWAEGPVRWNHKWYLAENRMRKDNSRSASEEVLSPLWEVGTSLRIPDQPQIGVRAGRFFGC